MALPTLSIRTKVALASLLVLAIPYVGYLYVVEMENYLREGLESSVIGAATALAGAMHDRPDLLGDAALASSSGAGDLHVQALDNPMQIDGYAADWDEYRTLARPLAPLGAAPETATEAASLLAGKHGDHLYLLVDVRDASMVFGSPAIPGRGASDRVRLRTIDSRGVPREFVLSSLSPGWVSAYEVVPRMPGRPAPRERAVRRPEPRIRAEWQRTEGGYALEARVPLGLLSSRLAVEVVDVDAGEAGTDRALRSTLSGAGDDVPGRLLLPSSAAEGLIRGLARTSGRRVWVIDRHRRIFARGGSLVPDTPMPPIAPVFALLLRPPVTTGLEHEPQRSTLSGEVVEEALAGAVAHRWRAVDDTGLFVVAGAHPVWNGGEVMGAVVVEETTLGIQTARRQALAGLFKDTLIVFSLVALVLLLLATRIVTRLRRLRDETERAIDPQGRVVGGLSRWRAGDEIGDLGSSFAGLLERLNHYNQYLEHLARRLSHELRTPIAVTRSSLDAMAMQPGENDGEYLARARAGLDRLDRILTRMSEATRLEQSLSETQPETYDLAEVAAASATAYGAAWPGLTIRYAGPARGVPVLGGPDLLVQLLDKLVANARDFHAPGTDVVIGVEPAARRVRLMVENQGPSLPDALRDKLFEPMYSARDRGRGDEPHLGLGLYIVRLIARYHQADVQAENVPGGVRFVVDMPTARAAVAGDGPPGGS